jgi:hypothetical protein
MEARMPAGNVSSEAVSAAASPDVATVVDVTNQQLTRQ